MWMQNPYSIFSTHWEDWLEYMHWEETLDRPYFQHTSQWEKLKSSNCSLKKAEKTYCYIVPSMPSSLPAFFNLSRRSSLTKDDVITPFLLESQKLHSNTKSKPTIGRALDKVIATQSRRVKLNYYKSAYCTQLFSPLKKCWLKFSFACKRVYIRLHCVSAFRRDQHFFVRSHFAYQFCNIYRKGE